MDYRLLPLILVGAMEYKFMVELSGSREDKDLAGLFEKLLAELRDQIQGNYNSLAPPDGCHCFECGESGAAG